MIQALTPDGTDQALDVRILPRRLRSSENFLHAQPLGSLTKLSSIAAVAVAQQVSRSAIPRERIEQLMCYPFRRRICGHGAIVKNEDLLPATIGVFGDWGGGKSTLIEIVRTQLTSKEQREAGTVVLSFNGWLFEGYEGAKTALMGRS